MMLDDAVKYVNAFNRAGSKPLVKVAKCRECGCKFATQAQSAGLSKTRKKGQICPRANCQREARRKRQRGEK